MSAKDRPVSKPSSDKYRENYDRIFGKKDSENKSKAEKNVTLKNQRNDSLDEDTK